MIRNESLYTVESVTSGHPDKICDQISDAVLDTCLTQDPMSRVAVETLGSHGLLVIGGEVTTKAVFDAAKIARKIYNILGYKDQLKIITEITKQSSDIAQGVDVGGAGDQGIMYGYATDVTSEYLPLGVVLVHKLTKGLETLRNDKTLNILLPDGKAQVTVKNKRLLTILVSAQHKAKIKQAELKELLIKYLIEKIIDTDGVEILVNPTGSFIMGGFSADTGLTGRKIMVDTYGGLIPHGGGCFSGKDPTKVDRSGAYMARFVAKQLVYQNYAKRCLVSVAYAIGRQEPVMIEAVNEKGESMRKLVTKKYDIRPQAIIEKLKLRHPIYQQTSSYGHFGKADLPWEKLDDN
jgi:S-adenosylmethionine synthetase